MRTATAPQLTFIGKLARERQKTVEIPDVNDFIETLKAERLTGKGASDLINALLAVEPDPVAVAPGAVKHGPSNMYPGDCIVCGTRVAANAGERQSRGGRWVVRHHDGDPLCAPAAPAAKVADVIAKNSVAVESWDTATAAFNELPGGRYAVPSVTGTNDLTFFEIKVNQGKMNPANKGKKYFNHIVGGDHDDFRVSPSFILKCVAAVEALTVVESLRLYGHNTRYCGRCGKSLTKKASRDTGFGQKCADDLGVDWVEDPSKHYDDLDENAKGE